MGCPCKLRAARAHSVSKGRLPGGGVGGMKGE